MSATITCIHPSKNDVLGDCWAARVRQLFEQACAAEGITAENTEGFGAIWNLFQYQYCCWCDMRSRVVASPHAMAACGWKITDAMIDVVYRLLEAQSRILDAESV